MLKTTVAFLLVANLITCVSFLSWYFFGDGYLGYGYGELVLLGILIVFFFTVCILLAYIKRIHSALLGILIGVTVLDIWFISWLFNR